MGVWPKMPCSIPWPQAGNGPLSRLKWLENQAEAGGARRPANPPTDGSVPAYVTEVFDQEERIVQPKVTPMRPPQYGVWLLALLSAMTEPRA